MKEELVLNPYIVDHEEQCMRLLRSWLAKPWKTADKIGLVTEKQIDALYKCETLPQVDEVLPHVAQSLIDHVEEKWNEKRAEKAVRFLNKANNRLEYLPTGVLEHREAPRKGGEDGDVVHRWQGEIKLECPGLLPRYVAEKYDESEPCSISLINNLPPDSELGLKHAPIASMQWENMRELGLAVSGEVVAWQMNSAAWDTINRLFPDAIDARSYNHGLKAPLIAGGYIPDMKMMFGNLYSMVPRPWFAKLLTMKVSDLVEKWGDAAAYSDLKECLVAAKNAKTIEEVREVLGVWDFDIVPEDEDALYDLVPMGDDGRGSYHPNAPEVQSIVGPHGAVPIQFRAIHPTLGIFVKGILAPDERCVDADGNPTVMASWKQLKGATKKVAKQRATEDAVATRTMQFGALRTWSHKRFMVGCFELLENIAVVPREGESAEEVRVRRAQLQEDLDSLVTEAMEDLGKDGISGLLTSIAKDDPILSLVVKLIAKARARGIFIDPMSIDRVRAAMDEKLQRKLWQIAQGAGIRGRQEVIVIDAGLDRGTCVVSAYRPGTTVAAWRFPIVLAQALKVLKVVHPRPHHKVDGQVVENAIYMHPEDVLDMQGDDDGDIVAITHDPRVVRMFQNRIDERSFGIEPDGEKLSMKTNSPEGLEYLRSTPMGPVGLMTINRSKLLAVGDLMGALAMSVLVQESIDKAKRKVRWSDWAKACRIENWRQVNGRYFLHWVKANGEYYSRGQYDESIHGPMEEESTNFLDQRPAAELSYVGNDGQPVTIDPHSELAVNAVAKWVNNRLRTHGCLAGGNERQTPLGWRIHWGEEEAQDGSVELTLLNKRIHPSQWTLSRAQQRGYEGGNLVHASHDLAYHLWGNIESEFAASEESGDIGELVLRLLHEEGVEAQRPNLTWYQYCDIRDFAGINEFGENMKKAMALDSTTDDGSTATERYAAINAAYELLRQRMVQFEEAQGIQGLITIWIMETTPTYRVSERVGDDTETWYTNDVGEIPKGAKWRQVNNPNHAIHAIAWPGSPLMQLLGIDSEDTCDFLTVDRLKKIIGICTAKENAFEELSYLIYQTEKPGAHDRIKGKPIWECQHCKDALQTALVRHFRALKGRAEKKFLARIVGALNVVGKESGVGGAAELGIDLDLLYQMSDEELIEEHEIAAESDGRAARALETCTRKLMAERGLM